MGCPKDSCCRNGKTEIGLSKQSSTQSVTSFSRREPKHLKSTVPFPISLLNAGCPIFSRNTLFKTLNLRDFDGFEGKTDKSKLWQHFQGVEIETSNNIFDDKILNLMDFNCDQKNSVHFFYTLPFSKNRALIETTWLSNLEIQSLMDYDLQLENYIKNNYHLNFIRLI